MVVCIVVVMVVCYRPECNCSTLEHNNDNHGIETSDDKWLTYFDRPEPRHLEVNENRFTKQNK